MAYEPDETDMKILAYLGLDARMTSREIAKKAGLSRNTVHSRMKRLEQEGVIQAYITMCDIFNLGYYNYSVYIKLKNDTQGKRREILEYLAYSPDTWWVAELCGAHDLQVVFWTKKHDGIFGIWRDFKGRFQKYIQDAEISPYFGTEQCAILPSKKMLKEKKVFRFGKGPQYRLNKLESDMLTLLAQKGRMQVSEIAKQAGLPVTTVKYRIDRLRKKGVIIGSTAVVDHHKLGYEFHIVDFCLNSLEKVEEMEKAILDEENSWHLLHTAGKADIQCTMFAKDHGELYGIIDRIKDAFPGQIREVRASRFRRIVKGVPFAIR